MGNTPNIRFKGFTDDWEQRKFADFVKNVAKRNKNNLDLEPYAVTNDRGFIAQKEAHDDFGYMNNVDRTAYNIVPPNSFAYNPARINVGSLGYYEGTENVIVSSLYEVFQTEDYIDDRFLWHWFKSDEFPKWIEKLQEGSVRLYFYFDKLVQCNLMLPTLEEQNQISECLDNIDNLITLHQRKCDETKELKKYMLQKMFPKNGEKKPGIRFAGFTDDWEQRKVEGYASFLTGSGLSWDDISDDGEQECILYGNLYTDYGMITNKVIYKTKSQLKNPVYSEFGDVLIPASDTTPTGLARATSLEKTGVLLGGDINIIRPNKDIDGSCLSLSLNANKKELIRLIKGTTVRHIHNSEIKDIVVVLPTSKDEQRKISNYFKSIDNLITLHQGKCDEMKKLKAFMLQNMFPKKG